MPPIPIRLPTESTIGRSGQEANTRLINGYVETLGADQDGKSQFAIYARPGLTRWSVNSFTGVERGMVLRSDTELLAVLGTQIVSFTTAGVSTVLVNLAGTDRLTMALNENSSAAQIAIVSDGGTYSLLTGSTISLPTTSFSAPNSVTFLKGLFIFSTAGGTIFHSALNDGSTFNSLSFGYANSDPNALVRGIADAGFYYVFGTRTLEIWQMVGTYPFSLTPLQQYIPMGLLAKYSLAKGGTNGLCWVDHRGIVRYGRDGGAQRISTHSVERAIENLSDTDRPNINGTYFTSQGHEFYVMSSTEWTWAYDMSMGRWYEWDSYGLPRWFGEDAILFNEHWVASDYRNGTLYQINGDEYDDAGGEFVLDLWCPHVHGFPRGMIADRLDIDVASGVGLVSGTGDDTTPQISVSYSDDGGKTFRGERYASIGATGQYSQLISLNRLGRINQKGRLWRFRASARVLRAVIQASLRGRPCN